MLKWKRQHFPTPCDIQGYSQTGLNKVVRWMRGYLIISPGQLLLNSGGQQISNFKSQHQLILHICLQEHTVKRSKLLRIIYHGKLFQCYLESYYRVPCYEGREQIESPEGNSFCNHNATHRYCLFKHTYQMSMGAPSGIALYGTHHCIDFTLNNVNILIHHPDSPKKKENPLIISCPK